MAEQSSITNHFSIIRSARRRLIEWCYCSTDAKGVVFVRICDDSADPVELVQRALMEAKQSGVNLTKHVQARVPWPRRGP